MELMDEGHLLRTLELPGDASLEEIHHAYQRLKRLYADEGAAFLAPSMDEFSQEARDRVLAELETAHRELSQRAEAVRPPVHVVPAPVLDEAELPMDGPGLRRIREACGATLDYLTSQIHVRPEFLEALEDERFGDLPPAAVNVRGFLTAYVTELGLPVEAVVAAYMQRHQQWLAKR